MDVVSAVQRGEEPKDVARIYHIPISTLDDWLARYRQGGWHALRDRARSGRPKKVSGEIMRWLYEAITMGSPLQFKFDFCLWTIKIIKDLLNKEYNIELSKASISRLLLQLGLPPQRPIYKAVSKNPEAVEKYLEKQYPRIQKEARKTGAEVFFWMKLPFVRITTLERHGLPLERPQS